MARTKKKARKARDLHSKKQEGHDETHKKKAVPKQQRRKAYIRRVKELESKTRGLTKAELAELRTVQKRLARRAEKYRLKKLETKRRALTQAELEELKALREKLAPTSGAPDLPRQTRRAAKAQRRLKTLESETRDLTNNELEELKALREHLASTAGLADLPRPVMSSAPETPSSTDSEEDNDADELVWATEESDRSAAEATTTFEPQFRTRAASRAESGLTRTEVLTIGGRPAFVGQDQSTHQRQLQGTPLPGMTNRNAARNMVREATRMPSYSLFDAPSPLSITQYERLAVVANNMEHKRLPHPSITLEFGSYWDFDCKDSSRSIHEENLSKPQPKADGSSAAEKMVPLSVTAIDQEIAEIKVRLRKLEEEEFAEAGEMESGV